MTDIRLYDDQNRAIDLIRCSVKSGHRRPILVAPCGFGKTYTASEIIKRTNESGKSCNVLLPRRELVRQFASSMIKMKAGAPGIIMAGEPYSRFRPTQLCSWDTLHARAIQRERIEVPKADVVIVDEAHLSMSPARQHILQYFEDSIVIGVTATPALGNGKGLGAYYDDLVIPTSIKELVAAGRLVQPVHYGALVDTKGLKIRGNDFIEAELSEKFDTPKLNGDTYDNWKSIAGDRQSGIFCINRAHAQHVYEVFKRRGERVVYLDGETPDEERIDILTGMQNGKYQVVVSIQVLTYGVDIPALSCIVLARPTRSIPTYLQIAGRGLRVCENAPDDCVIIDQGGIFDEIGYVDDDYQWSLDSKETVNERRERAKKENKEPKEILCNNCSHSFSGRKDCPKCGHTMIPKQEEIPYYEMELVEHKREEGKRANKSTSWEDKQRFMGEAKAYACQKGFKPGWAAWQYKEKFGVWPNDPRVKNAEPVTPSRMITGWLAHQAIRKSFREKASK